MSRTKDPAAVQEILDAYTTATRARDVDGLRAVFHDNAVMSGYLGPDLLVGSPQPFFDFLAGNEVAPDYASHTLSIDVTGQTASATVVEDNLFGMSFVNHFHLVKDENGWSITSKLFHHDAPGG
ncbi:MAG: nuclear transport factor 2 family protein [Shimia sp.]